MTKRFKKILRLAGLEQIQYQVTSKNNTNVE